MRDKTCYMCDEAGTTKEHVPAKVFFPEKKDIVDGEDYRRNLITVNSCELHNTATSEDDTYAAFTIVAHFANSHVATDHVASKVLRALDKKPRLAGFFKTLMPVEFNGCSTGAFQVSTERLDGIMAKIARALHWRNLSVKLRENIAIHVVYPGLKNADLSRHPALERVDSVVKDTVWKVGCGSDLRVFRYWYWLDSSDRTRAAYRFEFYGGFPVVLVTKSQQFVAVRSGAPTQRRSTKGSQGE